MIWGRAIRRTENIVSELGVLQAERAELLFGLGSESVAASGPEVGNRSANRSVVLAGVGVDVTGVGDFALGRGVDTVNLAGGKALELLHTKLFSQSVDSRVFQQLIARFVDRGQGRVGLEDTLAGQLLGEVVARVKVF